MKHEETTNFDYNKETGAATAIIHVKGKIYVGTAYCHPDDMEFANQLTGCDIAYRRASIKMLKDIRDNELIPGLKSLNAYLYSINKGQYFDKKNPMVKILYHNITQRQNEIDMINEMIKNEKAQLKEFIDTKDALYQKLRAKRAKLDENKEV